MTDVSFAHVGLTCQDPLAVERFYIKHFGFRRVRVIPLGDGQIVFTRSGSLVLEIFQAQGERPVPPAGQDGPAYPGWRHLSFAVPDVEKKLAEMGPDARVTLGPLSFDDFIPGWKTVWIADPEGNILEITQGFTEQDTPPPLR